MFECRCNVIVHFCICLFQLEVENKLKNLADMNSRYKTQVGGKFCQSRILVFHYKNPYMYSWCIKIKFCIYKYIHNHVKKEQQEKHILLLRLQNLLSYCDMVTHHVANTTFLIAIFACLAMIINVLLLL